jgi:hypothetical protein
MVQKGHTKERADGRRHKKGSLYPLPQSKVDFIITNVFSFQKIYFDD